MINANASHGIVKPSGECHRLPSLTASSVDMLNIYRRTCMKDFSVNANSVLHGSEILLTKWVIGFCLYPTDLKDMSSMKLHRDLEVTQKSAWHMAHRIREAFDNEGFKFIGSALGTARPK